MFGNLSIRSKLLALLTVPVAGSVLLGVAGVTGDGHDGQGELRARRRRVDAALAAYRAGVAGLGPTGDPALDQAAAVASERLDRLALVRVEVDRRLVTPERAMAGHDAMVDALLGVARGLAADLEAPAPARAARLLLALSAAKEATGQERVVLAATPAPARARAGVLRVRLAATAAVGRQELNGIRAAAGTRLEAIDRALGVPGARTARGLELALLDPAAGAPAVGDLRLWRAGLTARAGTQGQVEREVAADLAGASRVWLAGREGRLRDRLVLLAVILVASLAAVLLVVTGPLGRGAAGWGGALVPGLAKRGQALAARQLQLLEELATEEPDPHRRQGLLGVDHLANRLRRTAETLFSVAGTEPAGRWARPVPLNVLLRSAVAEADPGGPAVASEPGQEGSGAQVYRGRRVDLLTTGEVEVEGPAGIDLVHLLAELIENAVTFSAPRHQGPGGRPAAARRLPARDRGPGPWDDRRAAGQGQSAPRQAARRRLRPGQDARLLRGHPARLQARDQGPAPPLLVRRRDRPGAAAPPADRGPGRGAPAGRRVGRPPGRPGPGLGRQPGANGPRAAGRSPPSVVALGGVGGAGGTDQLAADLVLGAAVQGQEGVGVKAGLAVGRP